MTSVVEESAFFAFIELLTITSVAGGTGSTVSVADTTVAISCSLVSVGTLSSASHLALVVTSCGGAVRRSSFPVAVGRSVSSVADVCLSMCGRGLTSISCWVDCFMGCLYFWSGLGVVAVSWGGSVVSVSVAATFVATFGSGEFARGLGCGFVTGGEIFVDGLAVPDFPALSWCDSALNIECEPP